MSDSRFLYLKAIMYFLKHLCADYSFGVVVDGIRGFVTCIFLTIFGRRGRKCYVFFINTKGLFLTCDVSNEMNI